MRSPKEESIRVYDTDRGATIIIVAISLLLLIGIAALAIDGGMAYRERRSTQGVADNAALAAAWAACTNPSLTEAGAAQRGVQLAQRSDYEAAEIEIEVSRVDNTATADVTLISNSDIYFARAISQSDVSVRSDATARCTTIQGGLEYALFAIGRECASPAELRSNVSSDIVGNVHSNGKIQMTGAGPIDGHVTYGVGIQGNFAPDPTSLEHRSGLLADPVSLDISLFRPPHVATANYYEELSNDVVVDVEWLQSHSPALADAQDRLIRSGIFYSQAGFDLQGIGALPGITATFVTPRRFEVRGSGGATFRAHHDSGVAIFAGGGTCGDDAITLNQGNPGITWEGLIYAPNGRVRITAQSATTVKGSIVGRAISIQSQLAVNSRDTPWSEPSHAVELLE